MSNEANTLQTCPVCGVSITEDGQVNFSSGSPGSRARLFARVCTFNKQPGCINQKPELIGEITRADGFETGEDLVISMPFDRTSQPVSQPESLT